MTVLALTQLCRNSLMGSLAMINEHPHAYDLDFSEMMRIKRLSRNRQVEAVYAASPQALDLASESAKAILRGKTGSIARPKRFTDMSDC